MKSKNKASEESKQSDAGKCKVNHGDSSGRAAAAEPEIDVKDMPDFGTHEDLSWWGFTKHAEAYCGKNMWLFLASQNLPGFNAAIESVKRGLMAFNAGNDEPAKGPIDFTEIFFTSLRRDPEESLKTYHTIVSSAAIRGDVEFFNRMQREIRKGKRRSDGNGLKFHLLTQWVHGFLWLMSDDVGYSYLRFRCDFPISFTAFQKERSRLGLVGYETFSPHPIITGHDLAGRFTFREGWTNLEPTLSK